MSVGSNIRNLREKKGVSQKELSDVLSVTPQAVSRWENDAVEPSIETLRMMSSYFEVSLDVLLQKEPPKEETVVDAASETEESLTPGSTNPEESPKDKPIHELAGLCARCGKAIYRDEDYGFGSKEERRRGGRGNHGTITHFHYDPKATSGKAIFCKSCCEEIERERQYAIRAHQIDCMEKGKKGMGWGLFTGIFGGLILALISLYFFSHQQGTTGGWLLGLSPVLGYLLFSLVYVLVIDNTFVSDLFLEVVSIGFVKMPGVIFSLDFDGIAFLIAVKILLAVLGFAIALAALVAAVLLAGIFACFVFPYSLRQNKKECGKLSFENQ